MVFAKIKMKNMASLPMWTLPGYRFCENLNKTGFLVVCSLFYLPYVMKFSIESSFPCYYGISVFNLHNHTLPFTKQFFILKRYILYSFKDPFLSYLSLFRYFLKVWELNTYLIHWRYYKRYYQLTHFKINVLNTLTTKFDLYGVALF